MLLLLSLITIVLISITLFLLQSYRPVFQYSWLIAMGGSLLLLIMVFIWQVKMPITYFLSSSDYEILNIPSPSWKLDSTSWPITISISTFTCIFILASASTQDRSPKTWVFFFLLGGIGYLVATAGNPIALVMSWTFLDFSEIALLVFRKNDGAIVKRKTVIGLSSRMLSIILMVLTTSMFGEWNDFQIASKAAYFLFLFVVILRIEYFPFLSILYSEDNQHQFGAGLRLISTISGIILLARLPENPAQTTLDLILFLIISLLAVYAGWQWFISNEKNMPSYWILGCTLLSFGAYLRADQLAVTAWGTAMIILGSFHFLNSFRKRSFLWIPLLSILGITSLPYSLTATSWLAGSGVKDTAWLFMLPGQALLLTGHYRHIIRQGENASESHPTWVKGLNIFGLTLISSITILLGVWGWEGSRIIGNWPMSVTGFIISTLVTIIILRILPRLKRPLVNVHKPYTPTIADKVIPWFANIGESIEKAVTTIITIYEGSNGLLWSILILVLLLSILIVSR